MHSLFCAAQRSGRRAAPLCFSTRGAPTRSSKLRSGWRHASLSTFHNASDSGVADEISQLSHSTLPKRLQYNDLQQHDLLFLHRVLEPPIASESGTGIVENDGKSNPGIQEQAIDLSADSATDHGGIRSSLTDIKLALELLRKLVGGAMRGDDGDNPHALATLPATAFSELLRCLDPVEVMSKERDPTAGIRVSPGMATRTPLGNFIDIFGVRKSFVLLYKRILAVSQMRARAGRRLADHDFIVLLRCAGAASDPDGASSIWKMFLRQDPGASGNSSVYIEYLKARYLTEPLYYQYDEGRLRARPVNLWKSKLQLAAPQRWLLRSRQRSIALSSALRYGDNRRRPHIAEHLSRITRKRRSPQSIITKAFDAMHVPEEALLRSAMLALGRSGSKRSLEDILKVHYGIVIERHPQMQIKVFTVPDVNIRPDSPLYPTAEFLETIVGAYCAQGDVHVAFHVVDHISVRFGVPVHHKIWKLLLEWSYFYSLPGIQREWTLVGMEGKFLEGANPLSIPTLWNAMISPPNNFQPDLRDYGFLVKWYIVKGKHDEAIKLMLQLRPYYDEVLTYLEASFYTYLPLQRLGIAGRAKRDWRTAEMQKYETWHSFQLWISLLLKWIRGTTFDDELVVRTVPRLIEAYRAVLPEKVRYHTSTGIVELENLQSIRRFDPVEGELQRPAWVTGDLVAPIYLDSADVGFKHEDLAKIDDPSSPDWVQWTQKKFRRPELSYAERLTTRPAVKLRRPRATELDPERFMTMALPLRRLFMLFT